MMNVCSQCFIDRELVAFINSQNRIGKCHFCDSKELPCIDIVELSDFFLELISHFTPDLNGKSLKSIITENWRFFSSEENANRILNHVLTLTKSTISHSSQLVSFTAEILENIGHWEQLKTQLLTKSRYITDVNYLTDELGWDAFFSSQIEIKAYEQLFRARLHHASGEMPFTSDLMRCPPAESSKAGRANPTGIPYLYLSDRIDTVIYEIRATYLDEVSVGTFQLHENIPNPILISDFTETSTLFHPSQLSSKIKASLLKRKISEDLSKPMRRYDSELDYVPTQFICEFIKIYTGVNGIKFRSSLHTLGNNYVIFDQNLMRCISVQKVKVNKVEITL